MDVAPAAAPAPQAPGLSYRPAPLLPRIGAYIIDLGVGLVPTLIATIGVFAINPVIWSPIAKILYYIVTPLWLLIYFLTRDSWREGASIGKRALKIMVVYLPDNQPCTLKHSFIRNLVLVLTDIIPVIGPAIEPVVLVIDDKSRRIGDKVAKTQVIEVAAYRKKLKKLAKAGQQQTLSGTEQSTEAKL